MDLNACLDIISARGACKHESTDHDHECPSGQTIDLLPSTEADPATEPAEGVPDSPANGPCPSSSEEQQQQHRSVERFRQELGGLEVKDLVKAFNKAQEERVATYRMFDEGLDLALSSTSSGAGMDGYTGICAEATASFAALSNLVNAVESLLRDPERNHGAVASLIRKVQVQEKEKLSVTAALHLERMRLMQNAGNHVLLQQGVQSLEQRLGSIKTTIVEVLEEIKYETEEFFCSNGEEE